MPQKAAHQTVVWGSDMRAQLLAPTVRWVALAAVALGLPASMAAPDAPAATQAASAYLSRLPAVSAAQACPDADAPREALAGRVNEVIEALDADIAERERVLKEVRKRNARTQQQAALGTPGEGGVDPDALKKMSRAERQKLAMQMAEQRYGVSPEEVKKLKEMKKSGNQAGAAAWGQAFTAEQQAAAAADPARAAQAQSSGMDTARLAMRMQELAQQVNAPIAKYETQKREMAEDTTALAARTLLAAQRKSAEAVAKCEARVQALKAVYAEETRYCQRMAPRQAAALEGLRTGLVSHLGDYAELDRNEAQIQWLQFGVQSTAAQQGNSALKIEPEQDGLSALKAVRTYAQRLSDLFAHNLHGARPQFEAYCAGAR